MLISYGLLNARRSEQTRYGRVWQKRRPTRLEPVECYARLGGLPQRQISLKKLGEMERDVNRLTAITERFSKIGSQPE